MSKNVLFFINGSLIVTVEEYFPENSSIDCYLYEMRFLVEVVKKCLIEITMIDKNKNEITYEKQINGLELIKVDCTVFMESYNWEVDTVKTVKYKVRINKEWLCDGSFQLISPNCGTDLSFAIVSNNNATNDAFWKNISKQNPDIILHIGNQIQPKYVSTLASDYTTLYKKTFNNKYQSEAMRNAINVTVFSNGDIFWQDESDQIKYNSYTIPKYFVGMNVYVHYQHQLCTDLFEKRVSKNCCEMKIYDVDEYSTGHKPIYFSLVYGKYKIIALCTEQFHKNCLFSDRQLSWLDNEIEKFEHEQIILISPISIGYLNRSSSNIVGLFCKDVKCDFFHPNQYNTTMKLVKILSKHKNKKIVYMSHSKVESYINAVFHKTHPEKDANFLLTQLVVGPIAAKIKYNNNLIKQFFLWMQEFLNSDIEVTEKEDHTVGHSFASMIDNELYITANTTEHAILRNTSRLCW